MRHFLGFFANLTLAAVFALAADKPTKVEIGKRGKAATAFVDIAGRGSGTAFCVHPSGLFVTNEHVVRGADKADITLVLNPSLPTEKALKALVVRVDKERDLALLRTEAANLPSLPLGSDEGVAELADVVAVGFPLGRLLSPDRKEYPAVSVNAGSVTALRHKKGDLEHIQVDVSLTFGNSGGPVLDNNGKVIGVVVSGISLGKGINQAIPVSKLSNFLLAPDIAFAPPELTLETLGKDVEFRATAVSAVPGSPEAKLKLILQAGDEPPREFDMTKRGTAWVTTAAPASRASDSRVEVTVRAGGGTVVGLVENVAITVGGKPFRLGNLLRIDLGPKPQATLTDGRTVDDGIVAGLGPVEIAVGSQTVKFDLSKATQVSIQPSAGVAAVVATVVASVDGKEVGRVESRIPVRTPSTPKAVDPATVAIVPAALDGDTVVKRLPDTFSNVVLGGGGRYLIFHLPKLKKLALYDVNETRVTKFIPLTEDKIAFAAGLDAIFVGLPKANRLERWSLTTFDREKSVPPPFNEAIDGMVMGYGSTASVVVNGYFLDPVSFRQQTIADDKGREKTGVTAACIASADGSSFTTWNTQYSPATSTAFVLEGEIVKRHEGGDLWHAVPGPDGSTVYTGKGIVSRTLQRADKGDEAFGYCLPAVRSDFFLSLSSSDNGKGGGYTIYHRGLRQPIVRLDKPGHGLSFNGWDRESLGPWKRVCLIPDAKVIAVLPASNDQVILHKFDADAALVASGLDYLFVTSRPPTSAKPGTTWTYPIVVKSKGGKVTFKLGSGPKGMAVSTTGVVTWPVPADASGEQMAILSIADGSGQEVFHTFAILVGK